MGQEGNGPLWQHPIYLRRLPPTLSLFSEGEIMVSGRPLLSLNCATFGEGRCGKRQTSYTLQCIQINFFAAAMCWNFSGNLALHEDSLSQVILGHCAPGAPGPWLRGAGARIWATAGSLARMEVCMLVTSCNSSQVPCNSSGPHRSLKGILVCGWRPNFCCWGKAKTRDVMPAWCWHHSLNY